MKKHFLRLIIAAIFMLFALLVSLKQYKDYRQHDHHPIQSLKDDKYQAVFVFLFTSAAFLVIILEFAAQVNHIKQRKILEKELRKLEKSHTYFLSVVSHDLKGPLNGIKQLVDFVNNNYLHKEEKTEILKAIKSTAFEGVNIIDNLLTGVRFTMQKLSIDPSYFKVCVMIKKVIDEFEDTIKLNNLKVENNIKDASVFADPEMVQLVLRNIISKSIKSSAINSKIGLEAKYKSGSLEILIKNPSMPSNLIEDEFLIKTANVSDIFEEKHCMSNFYISKKLIEINMGQLYIERKNSSALYCLKIPCHPVTC